MNDKRSVAARTALAAALAAVLLAPAATADPVVAAAGDIACRSAATTSGSSCHYGAVSNLVAGDGNHFADVFVHDRSTGVTERVSVDSAGVEGKSISDGGRISADGRFVSFTSYSSNLVAGDTNGVDDVFVRDRSTGSTERVSVDSAGTEANGYSNGGTISADGQVVTFDSYASNLVPGDTNGWTDVFLHDRSSGVTERVSVDSFGTQGNFESFSGAPSADGRFVAFSSLATNLDPGGLGLDVFVRDRQTGVTERISKDASGGPANGFCLEPAISADGRFVIFTSDASDLVAGDTNLFYDVFVHDRSSGRTERVSVSTSGAQADQECAWPALSADGRFVAFRSLATNVVSGDTNGVHDDFVRGPYLTLEADPALVSAGSILTFTTWTGAANRLALLVATEINGTPTFVPAVFGSFDATGLWVFSATVPAGLSGIAAGFQTFGFVETGKADVSNAFTVGFQ